MANTKKLRILISAENNNVFQQIKQRILQLNNFGSEIFYVNDCMSSTDMLRFEPDIIVQNNSGINFLTVTNGFTTSKNIFGLKL